MHFKTDSATPGYTSLADDPHAAAVIGLQLNEELQVGRRQLAGGLLGPFADPLVEHLARASLLPKPHVVEPRGFRRKPYWNRASKSVPF